MWKQKTIELNKMTILPSIQIDFIQHYITLTRYYNAKTNKQKKKNNENFPFNTHTFYTTLYHTHLLLQCKEHIQITSNHRTINVETKKQKQ